jgi:hypothetical protein
MNSFPFILGTTATDIVIAVSTITILLRNRSGLKSTTDARVVRLVAYMVESGAVTAAVALADLALYHKFPTTNYHMPACFVLSKTYTISFYAVSTIYDLRVGVRTNDPNALHRY